MFDLSAAQALIDGSPFGPWWGFRVVHLDPVTVTLDLQPQMMRAPNVAQGGCAMTLADVAAWIRVVADAPARTGAVTLHQNSTFLGPARGTLRCTATLVRAGRSHTHVAASVRNSDDSSVSHHLITYAHLRPS